MKEKTKKRRCTVIVMPTGVYTGFTITLMPDRKTGTVRRYKNSKDGETQTITEKWDLTGHYSQK